MELWWILDCESHREEFDGYKNGNRGRSGHGLEVLRYDLYGEIYGDIGGK